MRRTLLTGTLLLLTALPVVQAQQSDERIDTAVVAAIKSEGLGHSQVMEILTTLSDQYGPRLNWSPEYRRAADWAAGTLRGWGIQNVYYDNWAPLGKGWTLKNFSAMMTAPVSQPVIAYPKAWSPGFREKEADVAWLDVKGLNDFDKYKGKLKGRYVLLSDPVRVNIHFTPEAERLADSVLLKMANADQPSGRGRRGGGFPRNLTIQNWDSVWTAMKAVQPSLDSATIMRFLVDQQITPRKLKFALDEGALCAITAGRGDGGLMFVQQAAVPQPADLPFGQRKNAYDPDAPATLPQVVMAAEHYNRLVRLIQAGQTPRLEMELEAAWTKADSSFNIIGEIPGTDLKDEIVIVGGHFDTWHAGTGATDDGTGSAASMEVMRILKEVFQKTGIKPRRTIRIGLWGGEEEGLHGSREYVSQYFGKRESDGAPAMFGGGSGELKTTPAYDKFSVYFNHDNGGGRLRGVYLQGNEAARRIFRSLLTAFGDPTAQTLTLQNTGGTDHLSFDAIGLPGFQFIQDPMEYDSRTHHSNMDVLERVSADDMKQAATMMALFVYHAAQRDAKFPRKPLPPAGR